MGGRGSFRAFSFMFILNLISFRARACIQSTAPRASPAPSRVSAERDNRKKTNKNVCQKKLKLGGVNIATTTTTGVRVNGYSTRKTHVYVCKFGVGCLYV